MADYYYVKDAKVAENGAFHYVNVLLRAKSREKDGEILDIGKKTDLPKTGSVRIVNAAGKILSPAFTDLRCVLRDFCKTEAEDLASVSSSAVAGGFGRVVGAPNGRTLLDQEWAVSLFLENAHRYGLCEILPTSPVSEGNRGEKAVDFDKLTSRGTAAFFDDGQSNSRVLKTAMQACAGNGALLILRAEDPYLASGVMNEGALSRQMRLPGISPLAEDIATARILMLAKDTHCRVHLTQVSTAASADMVRQAKKAGVSVTCDTSPQYFTLTEGSLLFKGANAKFLPPLRTENDVRAIISAIADGTIDALSTDHTPCQTKDKSLGIEKAPFGAVGLESAFGLGMNALVYGGYLTLARYLELWTTAPEKILGIKDAGKIKDFVLFDSQSEYEFEPEKMRCKCRNTPFAHQTLGGQITDTFIAGVYRAGK